MSISGYRHRNSSQGLCMPAQSVPLKSPAGRDTITVELSEVSANYFKTTKFLIDQAFRISGWKPEYHSGLLKKSK